MDKIHDEYYKLSSHEALVQLETSFDGLKKEEVIIREDIYGKNILI
jgi:hypothetical protein